MSGGGLLAGKLGGRILLHRQNRRGILSGLRHRRCARQCDPTGRWMEGLPYSGVLDFSVVGILFRIAALLAENSIPIFAISTYNTDYVLTKAEHYKKALDALKQAGYTIVK